MYKIKSTELFSKKKPLEKKKPLMNQFFISFLIKKIYIKEINFSILINDNNYNY